MNRSGHILNAHLFRGIFIGMLAILLFRAGGADAEALSLSCGQWNVVPTPVVGTPSHLYGVASISANDVWAVGFYSNAGVSQTLAEHWDGTQWSVVSSPIEMFGAQLYAATAISSNDVWAVGTYYDSQNFRHALTEHWDGTQWSIVPNPNKDGIGEETWLLGVAGVSSTDVWTVGFSHANTVVDHWDGTQWSIVHTPFPGGKMSSYLTGVTAISSNDVWTVGSYFTNSNYSLTGHWDGTQWQTVPSQDPGICNDILYGVSGDATNDVWAVGGQKNICKSRLNETPLVEHWDGTQWQAPTLPQVKGTFEWLYGVSAISPSDVWAIGKYDTRGHSKVVRTLTEHWDGTQWSVVASPNPALNNGLNAVTAAGGDLWAVGYSDTGTYQSTTPLVEFYC